MKSPEKPQARGISRRSFLKVATGVALGGLGVSACKTGESTPPTTVKDTVPTTIVPKTTTTAPSTTEAPTTTQAERTFASPEQQAQVEAVEENMAEFFALTPNDLELYKNQATFTPYPDGYAPITQYSDVPATRVLAINLGTFTSMGNDGQATIHMFGVMKEDGTRFVAAETLVVTDPEIAGEQFSELNGGRQVNVMNPIRDREYGTTSASDLSSLLDRRITMSEAISLLNSNPGLPMTIDVTADPAWLNSLGAPTQANPELKRIFEEVFELGSGEHMRVILDKYSPEELAAIGILKSTGQIPQEMLTHASAGQLLSKYAWNALFTMFNDIQPISLA